MGKQAIVIGLGQFGMALARALSNRSVEVLAIDNREDRVRVASEFVAEAAQFDATLEESLAQTSPDRRDVCVCAIGDESREASIIVTALLKQMGAKRVISRANDDVHARILTLVGAHRVVNPEREFGDRFANQVVHEGIRGELALGGGVLVSELSAPEAFIGHTLSQLELPRRFGVTVMATRRGKDGKVILPSAEFFVESGDILVVVGGEQAVSKMMESFGK